jgi:hypothetical protein
MHTDKSLKGRPGVQTGLTHFANFELATSRTSVKMDFPHDWTVLAAEEFETAAPRVNGDMTMEVLAQLRPSGRILDNFRVALAGSKALNFDADLFSLIPAAVFKGWRVKGQCWARDVAIRANVFSSGWIDLAVTIAMRELDVFDAEGAAIPAGEFLRILNDLDEDGPCTASYRFAVVVGEDNKPRIQIQSLPASAVFLSGKALLKG